jgi:small-conductance mechanosensitive channel
MADFVTGASANGVGASGLRAQIEALARSVPLENASATSAANADQQKSSAAASTTPAASIATKTPPSGIWGLTGDLFALSAKIHTLEGMVAQTDGLQQTVRDFRGPLVTTLKQLSQQGDQLATEADTSGTAALEEQKKQLDSLTAQFKQLSASVLPLSKMSVLLQLYKTSLTNWQGNLKSEYRADLKALLIRLAILLSILAVVVGFSELWKKTIFRYVHDPRRRYQFMLLRRIVMWFVIAIVIAFAFASQLGQVATFAGLITAGVAVALQNVILSIAGYFLLIGRYGIRVGDRVQISGVSGEVVDVGLIRMHVMELGPGGATGRVVAFSNSIVFQPTTGLFRQIPGTSFGWHEISLTLAPDTDYRLVEQRLLKVVEDVYADYREDMERQRHLMERTLSTVPIHDLRPASRLRLTSSGLEAVIRYPVSLQRGSEIDDRVTRELLQAIDKEPKLKLVGSGNSIRLRTDVTEEVAKS